jgi:rRNA maturation endonuclease Nob1
MKQKYYFLCNDGQKWFDDEPLSQCPRCGYVLFSAVKIKPPWLK